MSNPSYFGRVRLAAESAFNENLPSAPGSFDYTVECEVWDWQPALATFDRNSLVSGEYDLAPLEGRRWGSRLTLRGFVAGFSASTPSADPTRHAIAALLEAVMGSATLSGYAAGGVAASSLSTSLKADSGITFSVFKVGTGLLVSDGTTGRVMFIQSATDGTGSDHTLTPATAMGITPLAGETIFGSNTCFLSTANKAPALSFTVECQPLDADNRVLIGGWVPESFRFYTVGDQAGGAVLMWECSGQAADWKPVSGAVPSGFPYTEPLLPNWTQENAARLVVGSAGTAFDVDTFEWRVSQPLTPRSDPNARGGVGSVHVSGRRRVEMEYTRIVDGSNNWEDGLATSAGILAQFGDTPGATLALYLPAPVAASLATPGQSGDLHSQTYLWRAGYTAADTGSDASANSPARAAFL